MERDDVRIAVWDDPIVGLILGHAPDVGSVCLVLIGLMSECW